MASSMAAERVRRMSGRLREARELLGLVLRRQRRGDLVELAIHHAVDLVKGEVDAVVGHAALRKVVCADSIRSIATADERLAGGGLLGGLLLRALRLDSRDEHAPGLLAVFVLAARILAFDHDSGWKMREAYRRIGLVDVLATGAACAVRVHANV